MGGVYAEDCPSRTRESGGKGDDVEERAGEEEGERERASERALVEMNNPGSRDSRMSQTGPRRGDVGRKRGARDVGPSIKRE